MIVVADTSPICYLVFIGYVDVLPAMFGRVEIPEAVRDELSSADAPPALASWAARPPGWLKVHTVPPTSQTALSRLHAGEREAILLAERLRADLIILDERAARRAATERGLRVTGLLGVLKEAATRGLVDLPLAVERLRRTTFRATPGLFRSLLNEQT